MCMVVPQWAADELALGDDEERGVPVHSKPASEHPEWNWVVMDEAWMIMTEWFAWGLNELHENLVG